MEPISIYVHIPMCVKKCAYCDFTSYCGRMNQRDAYSEAVCREMREQAAFFGARRVNTVFFGGGTPTLMTGAQMERMMDTLRACFDLAADAEVTMEGNPGTLTRENLDAYRKAGVNRLSLGAQSLDDGLLQSIGRIHTNEQARQAVRYRCCWAGVERSKRSFSARLAIASFKRPSARKASSLWVKYFVHSSKNSL